MRNTRFHTRSSGAVGLVLLFVLVLLIVVVSFWVTRRPALPEALKNVQASQAPTVGKNGAPATPGTADALKATFVGVSTLMFDDGVHAVLVDGFFSRPGFWKTALGKVGPEPEKVEAALKRLGLINGHLKLLAVFTAHSHYDHAMDAPLVAKLTGATLVGSQSTAYVGLGQGLPADKIMVVTPGKNFEMGPFVVQFIRAIHSPTPWNNGHDGGELQAPLVPPVHAADYKEGGSYSLLFEYQNPEDKEALKPRWLVQGSAGFVSGGLEGVRADTVFLGIGTLGKKDAKYKEAYWLEVVTTVGAKVVVPVHWDDFTVGLDEPLKPMPKVLDNFNSTIDFLSARSKNDGVNLQWLGAFEGMDLPLPQEQDLSFLPDKP